MAKKINFFVEIRGPYLNHSKLGVALFLVMAMTTGCLFDKPKNSTSTVVPQPDGAPPPVIPPPPPDPLPEVKIQCERLSLSENSLALVTDIPASLNCILNLSKAAPSDMTFAISVAGTATEGSDYQTLSHTVQIAKGLTQASLTITGIDDPVYEPTETIILTILPDTAANPTYTVNLILNTVTLSILDDDLLFVDAYLNYSEYSLDEGNPAHQITWTIEFYDGNTGEPVSLPFDLKLTASPIYNRIDIAGRLSANLQNIVVPKNSATFDITVGIINDLLPQPIQSDDIKLTPDNTVVLSPYSYLNAYLTLYDDELPALTLVASATSSVENGGVTTFKAVINAPLSVDLTIPLTYSGTATRGADYRGSSGGDVIDSLTIPAGSKESASTNIVLIGDGYYEGSEYLTVSPATNPTLYSLGSPSSLSISINDDVYITPDVRSIELTATTQSTPPSITLNWSTEGPGATFKVYRKLITDSVFPNTPIASLAVGTSGYTDTSVSSSVKYEYQVIRASGIAYGYIAAGIDLPPVHDRGGVLLLVENTVSTALASEINQLIQDFIDDGWSVTQKNVASSDTVTSVKSLINQTVSDSGNTINSLVILGHVPVPYSGSLAPDGHSDHVGAWPADGYYGDLDNQNKWTDTSVNKASASRSQNRNIPGDGKFDQSILPLNQQLQVGRIDLSNLPAFAPLTEVDLLRRYLSKNHNYRKKLVSVPTRALFDDNWGGYGGGDFFATSMWRTISTIVGKNNIVANDNAATSDWFTQLRTNNYLFAYGGGGGSYNTVSGIGNTNDFAAGPSKAVFTALFGSYFGDWDSSDNVLRAPLAADGLGLTCVWSGRPEWYFHHMAIGETIGFSTRASENNSTTYPVNMSGHSVHMALMGDPTLVAFVVEPPSNLTAQVNAGLLSLDWTASNDVNVGGYYVYHAANSAGPYSLLNASAISTSHYEAPALSGTHYYRVRAAKWENTPSGGFNNLSSAINIQVVQ
ncbi:MAG: hypothetical protein B7Y39_14260 [Bdellovibrio sp. 28-41-41]|nr:MAG: hypothetical protein B7Y39_14260 [Bdellovibrio sp. 28-41-41]